MPDSKDKPCVLQAFQRQKDVNAWPGSPQFDGGHLAVSNRSWRTQWPQIDFGPCTKCDLCILFCPDAAIVADTEGYPRIEEDWCKGCGICAVECPKKCVEMIDESTRNVSARSKE